MPKTHPIKFHLGPMFSGKTSEIIREFNNARHGGKKAIMLKYAGDTREESKGGRSDIVRSHDGASADAVVVPTLCSIDIQSYDVVCIDEGQFFPDLFEFVKKNCKEKHRKVFVASLDTTFKAQWWPEVWKSMVFCSYKKHTGVCFYCGSASTNTMKIGGDMSETVEVG
ncbi:MAG: hypothetical protein JSS82_00165, partial [Bacteroidetes bacterium]|nr:hypothetical protein [Bacteroidota bacterium]